MTACQLCTAPDAAPVTLVPSGAAALCPTCAAAMTEAATDGPHWTCLHDAVWSDDAIVQGMAWRVLTQLGATGAVWANDLMDICDPSPDVRAWAEAGTGSDALNAVIHRDSNGAVLAQGDTVTLQGPARERRGVHRETRHGRARHILGAG